MSKKLSKKQKPHYVGYYLDGIEYHSFGNISPYQVNTISENVQDLMVDIFQKIIDEDEYMEVTESLEKGHDRIDALLVGMCLNQPNHMRETDPFHKIGIILILLSFNKDGVKTFYNPITEKISIAAFKILEFDEDTEEKREAIMSEFSMFCEKAHTTYDIMNNSIKN